MRLIFFCVLASCLQAYAQEDAYVYPAIARSGTQVRNFVPAGWDTLATARGDLNKDSIPDVAVVIERKKTVPLKEDEFPAAEPRMLLVLFKGKAGLILACKSTQAILLSDEGGATGDPFEELSIDRGCIVTSFFGGSSEKWNLSHRYRYQQGDFYLIGADASGGNASFSFNYSYNVITGRLEVEADYEESPGKNQKYQKVVKQARLPLLKSFEPWSLRVGEDIHF
jgi:hypothetical protein